MKRHGSRVLALLLTLAMTVSACGSASQKADDSGAAPAAAVLDKLTFEYAAEAAKSVYTSASETLILRSDGRVIQLKLPLDTEELVPGMRDIVDISGGAGLRADGTVMDVTLFNARGILDWTDLVSVDMNSACVLGLHSDGTVSVEPFSDNWSGVDAVSEWTDITVVSVGFNHAVGLRSDGTVVAAGSNDIGQCDVSGWKDIVAVSAGFAVTVGLRSDGRVVATGTNNCGQCDVSDWKDIVAISAGDGKYTVGLRSDGTVVAAGNNENGQCNVSEWTDIIAVAAGDYHTIGIRSDGTAVSAGTGDWDQSGPGWLTDVKVPGVEAVEPDHEKGPLTVETARCTSLAASAYTLGLQSGGTVLAAGTNEYGQCNVSGWTDIVAVAAGSYHSVGLRADGMVLVAGETGRLYTDAVKRWTGITAIASRGEQIVGLRADGTVVAAGPNDFGECDVEDWAGIIAIEAGFEHTVGLRSDGTVVAAGNNDQGQCDVSGWTDIVAVAAGRYHTVGLRSDGTVVVTKVRDRLYDYLQGYVEDWTDIVAISAGVQHTVGLRSDGTVVAVGSEDYGQCDVEDWTGVMGVVAGWNYTLGLKKDGTVLSAGYNADGQCDVYGWTDIRLPYDGEIPGWTVSKPEVKPAEPLPEPEDDPRLIPAYEAYLRCLEEDRPYIEQYSWKSQTVALSDITDDGLPELIYMRAEETWSVTLRIATYRDGQLVWLYSDDSVSWDGQVGGGYNSYLFKIEGDTALYGYRYPPFETEGVIFYSRFTETADGTLELTPVCRELIHVSYGEEGYSETIDYEVDGKQSTEEGYLERAEQLKSSITEIFQGNLFSSDAEDLSSRYDMESLCHAMSLEEAVSYLRGAVGTGGGQEGRTRVDVADLPDSLNAFLKQFNDGYSDITGSWKNPDDRIFDYEHAADGSSNIMAGILSPEATCVEYTLYPGNWTDEVWGEADPRGWQASYRACDGPAIDWIAKNIFNISDEDILTLTQQGYDLHIFYVEDMDNGDFTYYVPLGGGVGGFFDEVRLLSAETDGVRYYVTYEVYEAGPDGQPDGYYQKTYQAEVEYKTIDGQNYWSLYRNGPAAQAEEENDTSLDEWLGVWCADSGEYLDIQAVSDTGLSLMYHDIIEIGFVDTAYEMEFDNAAKTIASEIGDFAAIGGWEYTLVLGDGYITVQSRYPDQLYFKSDGTAPESPAVNKILIVTGDDVNIRSGPGTDYESLGKADRGTHFTMTDKTGSWYQITYNGSTAYIIEDYVTEAGDYSVEPDSGTLTVTANDVNIRTGPGTEYESIGKVSYGVPLAMTGKIGNWYQIDYYGTTAYIIEDYVIRD